MGAAALESGATDTLAGVMVLHRLTVRIRLLAPDASFLQKLAFPIASVVRPTHFGYPLGLGPWRLSGRDRNGTYVLTPRPYYHSATLALRSLRLVPVQSASQAYVLYRSGAVDVTWVPSDRFAALSTHSDFHGSDALDAYFAVPDRQNALALAASLNREDLASAVGPSVAPLQSIVPPAVPDYVPSTPAVTDPNSASPQARLVADDRRDSTERAVARALERQWPDGTNGARRVYLLHVTFLLPDPGRWLGITERATHSRWYRSLLAGSNALTNDPVTRMSQYNEGEGWALEHAYIIPLLSGRIGYLVKPSVGSLQVTPLGIMPENNNWSLVTVA
jgi:ABC-type oligopeptide transport system substrate-binding subunit